MERPESPPEQAPVPPATGGAVPADAEETLHERHQTIEETRHQPRESGSSKEGGPCLDP
jgi:hypothetical protein